MNTSGQNGKRRMIIDTDPGIDDAIAIAFSLFAKELDVQLLTTVSGNVGLEKVTTNALRLLDFFEKEIPVAKGAARPLVREIVDASDVHGSTGMAGFEFTGEATHLLSKQPAILEMHHVLHQSEGKTTIVAIGPLTNVAMLLRVYPEDKEKIDEIVLMGGNITRGNLGVFSEFNIGVDPEAAHIVFTSGLPITMAPLEVGNKTRILPEDSEKIKKMNKTGTMMYHLFKNYRSGSFETGLAMYDSCAIGYLLQPTMYRQQASFVGIELAGAYTKGATVVDLDNLLGEQKNVNVLVDVDPEEFRTWFLAEIEGCI